MGWLVDAAGSQTPTARQNPAGLRTGQVGVLFAALVGTQRAQDPTERAGNSGFLNPEGCRSFLTVFAPLPAPVPTITRPVPPSPLPAAMPTITHPVPPSKEATEGLVCGWGN